MKCEIKKKPSMFEETDETIICRIPFTWFHGKLHGNDFGILVVSSFLSCSS